MVCEYYNNGFKLLKITFMGSEENGEAQYNIRRQKLKKNKKFQYCDPLKYLHASRLSTPDPIHIQ